MEEFWNIHHSDKNDYWLSGCYTGEAILTLHNIHPKITGLSVLDIGIGKGYLTRHLHQNGNTVYSCDISTVALENVKDVAKTYKTKDISKIEPVDLIISNLVFQHCNDEEIFRILREVNLKQGGIFSFQFAFLREEPSVTIKRLFEAETLFFRTLDTIKDMVDRAGKQIVSVSEPIHHYGEENISWHIVKIKNKEM